jgi:hypothetical protein
MLVSVDHYVIYVKGDPFTAYSPVNYCVHCQSTMSLEQANLLNLEFFIPNRVSRVVTFKYVKVSTGFKHLWTLKRGNIFGQFPYSFRITRAHTTELVVKFAQIGV